MTPRVHPVRPALAGTLALVALAGLAGCTPKSLTPVTFPLAYRFMGNPGEIDAAPECARVGGVEATDAREDREVVGSRSLQDGAGKWDIRLAGDVEAWLEEGADRVLTYASVARSPESRLTLALELVSVTMTESTYVQSEFDGRVVIHAVVRDGSEELWSERKDGFAENYGRPGNPENYQETLNHALDRALTALVNDPGFRDAVCSEAG